MATTYDFACKLPPTILGVFGVIFNAAMIIGIIWRGMSRPYYFLFTCIGVCNIALSIVNPVRINLAKSDGNKVNGAISVTLIQIQNGLHFTLAYDRWLAVSKPFEYAQPGSMKQIQKRTLKVAMCTVVSGLAIAIPNYNIPRFKGRCIVIFSLSFTIAIAILYYKIYRKMKENNARVAGNSAQQNNESIALQQRKKEEEYVLKMSVWIIGSLLITNLPLSLYIAISESARLCSSVEFTIMHDILILNFFCDPITFFISEKRKQSRLINVEEMNHVVVNN